MITCIIHLKKNQVSIAIAREDSVFYQKDMFLDLGSGVTHNAALHIDFEGANLINLVILGPTVLFWEKLITTSNGKQWETIDT